MKNPPPPPAALKFSEDRNGGRLSSPTPSLPKDTQKKREGTMDVHNIDDYFQENILSHQGQSGILTAVDLKIAFGVEKLLNLEMLVMETARRAADMRESQSISAQPPRMAFEFDVLHTIVDSEVGELEKLAGSIHMDIQSVVQGNKVEEPDPENRVEEKLEAATDSFNQMQELIATIRRESATFDKVLQPSQAPTAGVGYENCHMSPHTTTHPEDQPNVLHMLQKSIASELDLGKELCDTRSVVEQLKMKLYQAEQQLYFLEESSEAIYERMLSAENASQLFLGTSNDLLAKFNTIGFNLSASVCREGDFKSKLGEGLSNDNMSSPEKIPADSCGNDANQEAMQMQTPSLPEFSNLRDKIRQLEEWLRDSGSQPQWSSLPRGANEEDQKMTRSEIITFQDIINELKVAISKAEIRTQSAEERCTQLTQTNDQLYAELNSDRAGLLEKRLKESDTQLEHAKASVDAVVEQQNMLKASMSDMEQMIEDLKEKFLKAETRAENAESKCKLLTDTNLELSEELSFLRGRVEGLENSLRQANQLKTSTSKDIGIKTKNISDLVAKLALERERLHQQIVTLTKKNKMLAQKCRENVNETTFSSKTATAKEGELRTIEAKEEAVVDSSSIQRKVTPTVNTLRDQEAEATAPLEDDTGAESTLETVRSIEPSQLNWKYISTTVLVLLAAVLVYLLYKEDGRV